MNKTLLKKAEDNGRTNRGECMNIFAQYYKENCSGFKLKDVKCVKDLPWTISEMFKEEKNAISIANFIKNYRRSKVIQ